MRAITAPKGISNACKDLLKEGHSLGLVPTMGALHDGHLSLIERSLNENDFTVVSIFVNPIQFNKEEDLVSYPRTIDEDLTKLESMKVDFVFMPSEQELYQDQPHVSISFGYLEEVLEGAYRPGHFGGVGVVVTKLFNLINPTRSYFGLKDLQQFLLIKRMVTDLSFEVEVVGVETKRGSTGLALSSRNQRLSLEGVAIASNIYQGLKLIEVELSQHTDLLLTKSNALEFYRSVEGLDVEYLELVNTTDLKPVKSLEEVDELAICFAGYVEGVRLIDNLYLRLK